MVLLQNVSLLSLLHSPGFQSNHPLDSTWVNGGKPSLPPTLCPSARFKCAHNLHSNTINADFIFKNGSDNNGIMLERKVCVCWGAGGGRLVLFLRSREPIDNL